jgi:hypothetical protein
MSRSDSLSRRDFLRHASVVGAGSLAIFAPAPNLLQPVFASYDVTRSTTNPPTRAAFYYPWYPGHWPEGSVYTPVLGHYSSTDPRVIDQHIAWAQYAGLNAYISSWWGQRDDFGTDAALPILLQQTVAGTTYPALRWGIIYEMESVSNPSRHRIADDLRYLETRAFNSPAYLRSNGSPVVFVYAAPEVTPQVTERWAEARRRFRTPIYLAMQVYGGWQSDPNQPDACLGAPSRIKSPWRQQG